MSKVQTDVHTEHCCVHHCKYDDGYGKHCTVVSGELKQSFKCNQIEFCGKLTEEEVKAAYAKGEERDYSEDEVKLLVNASCEAVNDEIRRRFRDEMEEAASDRPIDAAKAVIANLRQTIVQLEKSSSRDRLTLDRVAKDLKEETIKSNKRLQDLMREKDRTEKMRGALGLAMSTIENASQLLGPSFDVLATLNVIDKALK